MELAQTLLILSKIIFGMPVSGLGLGDETRLQSLHRFQFPCYIFLLSSSSFNARRLLLLFRKLVIDDAYSIRSMRQLRGGEAEAIPFLPVEYSAVKEAYIFKISVILVYR